MGADRHDTFRGQTPVLVLGTYSFAWAKTRERLVAQRLNSGILRFYFCYFFKSVRGQEINKKKQASIGKKFFSIQCIFVALTPLI